MSPSHSHVASSGEPMWLQRLNKGSHGRFIIGTLVFTTLLSTAIVTLQYSRGLHNIFIYLLMWLIFLSFDFVFLLLLAAQYHSHIARIIFKGMD